MAPTWPENRLRSYVFPCCYNCTLNCGATGCGLTYHASYPAYERPRERTIVHRLDNRIAEYRQKIKRFERSRKQIPMTLKRDLNTLIKAQRIL